MCRDDFIEARSTLSMPLKVSRQKKQKKKQHKVILFLFLNIDSTPRPCADCLFIWLACSARYTIFSLFFPTADFTLRSMKLRKKKWRKCFQFFYHPSRIAHHLPCRRAFRVKVTIIWGSIYFLLLFFFSFLEGILPQFPTAWEFHHSTVILIPLKKNSPHTIFFFFCFRRCVSWQDPGSREWNKLIRWKRGGGDSSRCMLCVKAGLKGAENSNTKRINNDFVRAYQKEPASDTTANTVKRGSSPS